MLSLIYLSSFSVRILYNESFLLFFDLSEKYREHDIYKRYELFRGTVNRIFIFNESK